jgi:hypothetical protein
MSRYSKIVRRHRSGLSASKLADATTRYGPPDEKTGMAVVFRGVISAPSITAAEIEFDRLFPALAEEGTIWLE